MDHLYLVLLTTQKCFVPQTSIPPHTHMQTLVTEEQICPENTLTCRLEELGIKTPTCSNHESTS